MRKGEPSLSFAFLSGCACENVSFTQPIQSEKNNQTVQGFSTISVTFSLWESPDLSNLGAAGLTELIKPN